MSRSFLVYTALSGAAVATGLLTGCDPICTNGVSKPGQGQVTRNAAGTCVQLVVTRPDAGEDDAGSDGGDGSEPPDAGDGGDGPVLDGGACGAGRGWTSRVLEEEIDNLTASFVFDAQGVGHYAYSKDELLYVGTTRPGDVPVRVEGVARPFEMSMAVAADGTRHVMYEQGTAVGYAHDTGGVWQARLLVTGWSTALALDARGEPHLLIGLLAPQVGYVLGTRDAQGNWVMTPLEGVGPRGDRERMVVDSAGHLHIALVRTHGTQNQVVYASNASGTWTEEPLDWWLPLSSPRYRIALEVDAEGRPSVVGSNTQGAWLWTKEATGWKSYGLGAYLSRGPALVRSARSPDVRHVLLDDADVNAFENGSTSQVSVRKLYGTSPAFATPPFVLETRDGGNAFPGPSALHVDDQDRIQAGFSYVHYEHQPDGGAPPTTRGLRYVQFCP
ncbi:MULTISPECIES: hypothetical protein [unclassified Corallococcus]|uniref:hypothetical protein n=1 Tax=unclassified Corallococcus TaxID=2685029 RepID=UPI001A8E8F85|nr:MULTISPECIES: hypothetical protein [unclassified Corallococcus]MBN9682221.1 hypothetical protein [Corallococcus sp. NCSPR001]WAS86219.1 hypothetical protein O0N60_04425 [Corallococcus sp. NCRR]